MGVCGYDDGVWGGCWCGWWCWLEVFEWEYWDFCDFCEREDGVFMEDEDL